VDRSSVWWRRDTGSDTAVVCAANPHWSAPMPARLVQVTILNNSDYPIVWQDDGRDHGFWQEPWYPSNIKNLKKGEQASFRLESGGIATGVKGWVLFKVDVPAASNVGARAEFFRLDFERAYIEVSPFQPPGFENHYLGPERYRSRILVRMTRLIPHRH